VFLHLTPGEAVPLADQLGPVPDRLRRYPLEDLAVGAAARLPAGGQLEAGRRERARLPAAAAAHDHSATCLYTLTPDRDFAIGPLPGHDRVLAALGAAHGFKFAPLLGRVLFRPGPPRRHRGGPHPFALDRPALTTPQPEARHLV
jgi:glycine/D-amino acid oxidase-like deaminating enzyme